MLEGLEKIIPKERIKYNEPMKNHTTIKIGGNADALVLPESVDEIVKIVSFAKTKNIPITVIGNGSKIVISDLGVEGIVIKIGRNMSNVVLEGNYIYAEAGATMPYIAVKAKEASLTGFEFACGIPGTIGGGIKMNAGAYSSEIKSVLVSCQYLDENLDIIKKDVKDLELGYRKSFFMDNPKCIVLTALFKLENGDKEEISNLMKSNMEKRKEKQPLEFPSAGSTFKRPEGYFVGKLIDDAGLRGYRVGDAEISTKHSGFIINRGSATADDVMKIVEHVTKVVKEKFSVDLHPEIEFIGRK